MRASYHHRVTRKFIFVIIISLAGLIGTPLPAGVSLVRAQRPEVWFSPDPVRVGIGQVVVAEIVVNDVSNLHRVELAMAYDPEIIEVLEIQAGQMLSAGVPVVDINAEAGSALFSVALADSALPVSGSGTIAAVKLQGRSAGATLFALAASLFDQGGTILPAAIKSGLINVTEQPMPLPSPSPLPKFTPAATRPPAPTRLVTTLTAESPAVSPTTIEKPPVQATPTATLPAYSPTTTDQPSPASPTVVVKPTSPSPVSLATPKTSNPPLPSWLFILLLSILLFLIIVVAIIVLVAIFAWYKRITGA